MAEATDGLEVGLLIYNAGAANRTVEFLDDSFEDSLKQIKLACIGPVALARHFAPAMRERGRGGIVLVGSLACLSGASLLAVYSAVKAFNVNFAEGLWAELRPHGVDVCCTPLGMTYTEALQRMGSTTTRKPSCFPRTSRARSSRTSATARLTLWERTIEPWHQWCGPPTGAHWSS